MIASASSNTNNKYYMLDRSTPNQNLIHHYVIKYISFSDNEKCLIDTKIGLRVVNECQNNEVKSPRYNWNIVGSGAKHH